MVDFSPDEEKIERLRRAMYSRSLSPRFKDRPRRELSEEKPTAPEEWLGEEPPEGAPLIEKIAPKAFAGAQALARWVLLGAVIFFLGAAGFFAYFFTFGAGAAPTPPSIVISGPPNVTGGEMTELQILVTNRSRSKLETADLIVTFPPGTRASQSLPYDIPDYRISLGEITSGEARQIPVRAVYAGSQGERATVGVEVEYRLAGSSSIYAESAEYEIAFSSSPVSIAIEGNTETISGQLTILTATVSSNAPAVTKDVLLSADFPFGFSFSSSDPRALKPGLWSLGDLKPGESKTVEIRGTLSGEAGDERVFRFAAGTRKSPDSSSVDTKLSEFAHRMAISEAFLGLAISVNDDRNKNIVVGPGEEVTVTIEWQNNLSAPITDAIIVARLSGLAIDGQLVRTSDGFYRSSDAALLWDKTTTNSRLANIGPGERGEVSFSFRMPESEEIVSLREPRLTISVNASGKRLSESDVPSSLQATVARTIKLSSDVEIVAQGLYADNPFGSFGPMPPKAGEETQYGILFTVTNTTNTIKNAKMTAVLPNYVRYTGMYLAASEDVAFDNRDGTITWKIGDIPSSTGTGASPPRQMILGIGFTPSTNQIGSQPILVRDITLMGFDPAVTGTGGGGFSSTSTPITKTAPNVTTNILGDSGFTATKATVVR